MRYLLLMLLPLLTILFACNDSESEEELEINFHVSGKVIDADGLTIAINAPSENGNVIVASSTIKSDGTFSIDGNVPGLGYYIMTIGNDEKKSLALPLKPQDHLKINTSLATFTERPNASGTTWSLTMNDYLKLRRKVDLKMDEIAGQQKTLSESDFSKIINQTKEEIEVYARNKINTSPDNPYNIILGMELFPSSGFETWNIDNLKALETIAKAFQMKYGDSPASNSVAFQYEQIAAGYEQYKTIENGTMPAPDFTLTTPDGKALTLSSLQGKVVLIDFWASWCGPCRKENPNLVKLYEKYKNKGFTILSVSLDDKETAWKTAIEQDGLVWPNHVSDLKGWQSPMTQVYGFNSIPHTVLVSKDGKILGVGLRGELLEQKIKSIL